MELNYLDDMFVISDWELVGYMAFFSICFLVYLWWTDK
jgi:hypothetical protein